MSAGDLRPGGLLADYSFEITAKDVDSLNASRKSVPAATRVNITYLGNEDAGQRLVAAERASALGLVPVPHLAARRIGSAAELEGILAGLAQAAGVRSAFVVAGDPAIAEGPFDRALDLIESGLLERYGIAEVGIAGYPEGHPQIGEDALWSALDAKVAALRVRGVDATIVTQFAFDADGVLAWIERLRDRGVQAPIRVGVAGPAGVRRLLNYARRFGVGSSASVVKKYGLSLTNLLSTAGPDQFVRDLSAAYRPQLHGEVKVHFYTFGGVQATTQWVQEYRRAEAQRADAPC